MQARKLNNLNGNDTSTEENVDDEIKIVDSYQELNDKCDAVISKIKTRKSKKIKAKKI